MRVRLLHPLVAAATLLAAAVGVWALIAGGSGPAAAALALVLAGAAAGFANSGST
jgi:hypothetical protein